MHLKRWLTGIIAVPILIYIIGPGPQWLFFVLIFSAAIIGLMEFFEITSPDLPRFIRLSLYLLTFLLFAAIFVRQILLVPAIVVFWAFVPMIYYMLTRASHDQKCTESIGNAVLGPVYVVLPLVMLVLIDLRLNGSKWVFFLLLIVFSSDTSAFYVGKYFGRHKLHKAVSPNKTWEGAVGGLVGSVFASLIFLRIMPSPLMGLNIIILVLVLAVAGQIGDLAESMLKRNCGIKDSGKILPGHGGLLDRIDGLLFSIPVLYIYLSCQ